LNQDTTGADAGAGDATLLLSLDGLAVTGVERSAAGTLLVEVATAAETAAACPTCGVVSTRVKQYVCTRPRDLAQGRTRMELVWRKRRWYCRAPWVRPQVVHRVDARGPGRRADHDTAAGACR